MSSDCGFLLRLAAGQRIGLGRRLDRTAALEDGHVGIRLDGNWEAGTTPGTRVEQRPSCSKTAHGTRCLIAPWAGRHGGAWLGRSRERYRPCEADSCHADALGLRAGQLVL